MPMVCSRPESPARAACRANCGTQTPASAWMRSPAISTRDRRQPIFRTMPRSPASSKSRLLPWPITRSGTRMLPRETDHRRHLLRVARLDKQVGRAADAPGAVTRQRLVEGQRSGGKFRYFFRKAAVKNDVSQACFGSGGEEKRNKPQQGKHLSALPSILFRQPLNGPSWKNHL